ncbi:MAG: CPBP family intramembrane metalloprotease [Gorillibacterium sp.]|nr:CPBP family intramembrane metalloprotease [Gorillibacterium sp.]
MAGAALGLFFVSLGEDLFWRGYVQKQFGFWFSTIGFGLLHFVGGVSISLSYAIQSGIFTFILGLLLSWVRKKTDSVYASAAIHGLYGLVNAIIVIA